ncbi:MAG: SGNH/GDSL hydrolase family protein [Verrucomicrobiota bacterium]
MKHHRKSPQRRTFFLVCALWSVMLFAFTARADGLKAGDTVAICGDSITEQKLYSIFIEDYLLMCQPTANLAAHQFGWSGERADGFASRIGGEILPFHPTAATTCYGMNDGAYAPIDAGRQTAYRKSTESIVKQFRDAGVRLIVIGSPGPVDSDTFDRFGRSIKAATYNQTLADLTRIAREVAQEQGVVFADVYTPMTQVMQAAKAKYGPDYHVAGADGIHPAPNGHLVMAYAFLKALGCSGDIGTFTWDARSGTATATEGHKITSYSKGIIEIESTRYPFCCTGKPSDPNSPTGTLEFLPFNEELNRLQLIVRNGSSAQLKVTWGSQTKVFTAAQLERGVNLAAEFPDNPFSGPFVRVDNIVRTQQNYETPAVKDLLHHLPTWSTLLPEEKNQLEQLKTGLVRKTKVLSESSRNAVTPVKHSIKIEPVS